MTIIDRYVTRTYLSSFVILLAVGMGLYVLFDLLVNIDEFTKDGTLAFGQVLRLIGDFYYHNLPLYFSQLSGPAMAFAAAFTFGMMLRNNEMTALVGSGVPLQRLAVPVVICSIFLVALWSANREILIPAWAQKISRSHHEIVGDQIAGVYCARDADNAILTALELYPQQGRLKGVYIVEPSREGLPDSLIEADFAQYDAAARTWRLERGRRLSIGETAGASPLGAPIRYEPVDEYPFGLNPAELALRQSAEWADLLSLREMNALLRTRNLANRPIIEMSRHIRLTYPLLLWTFLLLTIPFFLSRSPTNVFAAGGQALVVTGLFFATTFIAHGGVRDESWAVIAAWLPILIFAPVAVFQLANVKT